MYHIYSINYKKEGQVINTFTFDVTFYPGKKKRMIVPQQYYKHFHSINTIDYGPYKTTVECLAHQKNNHTIYISSPLKSTINLSSNKQLSLYVHGNTCVIPLTFGVFLAGFQKDQFPLGNRTKLFEQMSKAGEKLGFQTIFFGYQHVLQNKRKINGFYFQHNEWKRDIFDFPTVVYNRIPNRKIEHHPEVMQVMEIIRLEATIFNDSFFNKWEIYDNLMKNPSCSYLLPDTILHPSKQKVMQLLTHHPIYIKPIHGSRGDGIVKCQKLSTGEIECHFYQNDKPKINRYTDEESLFTQLFPNGLKGYVVQEEIPLLKKGKSAIDFRVHTNKNHKNSWEVTLIGAKFAGKGSLTTHVQRGGSIHVVEELFPKSQADRMTSKLAKTAVHLANAIEKSIFHPIGEIGFDLGMDQEGKVWLFEANAKPGFSIFDHPRLEIKASEVFSHLYKYAFYLHNMRLNKAL
ncbi:YheC/YheD family protein [Aquibacillus koreensis]|uniref:YheC/YheD family protein n=1 Tax=Aquibacillus koreensis TaxID=279446 RepID=A0A9X3WMW6_9BACI|nr:YheC/YheD family protein [Aquibacillus koreensis]MCT2535546.1 YheC/YheD family protein [Aquibacillus koreensis]MDC3420169.1 YheC/YheD family protein [Aquibacillus koreensis]